MFKPAKNQLRQSIKERFASRRQKKKMQERKDFQQERERFEAQKPENQRQQDLYDREKMEQNIASSTKSIQNSRMHCR